MPKDPHKRLAELNAQITYHKKEVIRLMKEREEIKLADVGEGGDK